MELRTAQAPTPPKPNPGEPAKGPNRATWARGRLTKHRNRLQRAFAWVQMRRLDRVELVAEKILPEHDRREAFAETQLNKSIEVGLLQGEKSPNSIALGCLQG